MTNSCPSCGCPEAAEILTPDGPHHGKLVCARCARFFKWLPRPAPAGDPPDVGRDPGAPPAAFTRGTPAQVALAESVRRAMLSRCRMAGLGRTAAVISAVTDATWFLANQKRPLDDLRWPSPDQTEAA